jgi:glyoxylase-like metal-dependent hydrolase (beta-lactamase superfamily II)
MTAFAPVRLHGGLQVEPFFDAASATFSYLLLDTATRECALLDTVLDFDAASGHCGTASAARLLERVQALDARVAWILETHVHADHLSAATWLRARTGARIGIGSGVTQVRSTFAQLLADDELAAGPRFDRLFSDGETLHIGRVPLTVWHTPGHTPACVAYVGAGAAFVGDTLFLPDCGTARCDFPGGDAGALYASAARLLALPHDTRLFVCHDYPPAGRGPQAETSVAEQRAGNIHVGAGRSREDFVALRTRRDAGLALPRLMWPSVQVNARAGDLPAPDAAGRRYLRQPVSLG